LDLLPDGQREEDRQEEKEGEEDEEADARPALLLAVLDSRSTSRARSGNAAGDRCRVDRRFFSKWTLGGRGADGARLLPLPWMTARSLGAHPGSAWP
jgi:hypothetical protein